MAALLAKPPDRPAAVLRCQSWNDLRDALAVLVCDPLFDGDPAVIDADFRRLLDAGVPPPERVSLAGDRVVLSWPGGRTVVLGE